MLQQPGFDIFWCLIILIPWWWKIAYGGKDKKHEQGFQWCFCEGVLVVLFVGCCFWGGVLVVMFCVDVSLLLSYVVVVVVVVVMVVWLCLFGVISALLLLLLRVCVGGCVFWCCFCGDTNTPTEPAPNSFPGCISRFGECNYFSSCLWCPLQWLAQAIVFIVILHSWSVGSHMNSVAVPRGFWKNTMLTWHVHHFFDIICHFASTGCFNLLAVLTYDSAVWKPWTLVQILPGWHSTCIFWMFCMYVKM